MTWPPPQLDGPGAQRGLRTLVHGGQAYVHIGDVADYLQRATAEHDAVARAFVLIGREMRRIGHEACAQSRRADGR